MLGSWRWNVSLGIGGSLLTLLFSLSSNGLAISSLRCLYAFFAFFVLAYLFRALLAFILQPGSTAPATINVEQEQDPAIGQSVDYSTPESSEDLNQLLKNQLDGSVEQASGKKLAFQPLTPPKLVSTQNREPEELAKAIRHLTGE
ncbi:hypothetical protein [Paenibacillus sp. OV219]|uniref:hypothetical protein n=1 Tax=Paenibacillus sp. OV219 TaxID=1884377 RepID=UPI0008C6BE06|nr:hypothetical protein [Paenibacillus sp. OV219]SEN32918.1 hypothetical protein SAMN05518847_102688 [Paenibacillus sp. OV219]